MSGAERHAPELAAVDVRDAVVLRQPLVDERVVRGQQIDDAPILADDAVEQQLHFAAHRLPQRIVEVGIDHRQRADALQAAQVEPLAGEVDRERLGARVLQHPADLLLEHDRIFQPSLAATVSSWSSGIVLQRKNDRRDARSRSLMPIRLSGLRASAGSASMR